MMQEPLVTPTDLEIIGLLSTGLRQTPANVGAHLSRNPKYMSERLRGLEDRGYIRDAPPAEKSGMYELTNLGKTAAFHIDTYVRDHHDMFLGACKIILAEQPQSEFYPDLITHDDTHRAALHELNQGESLTLPSDLHIDLCVDADYSPQSAGEALYHLSYHHLAERVDGMDVYRITERGEKVLDLISEGVTEPVKLTEAIREEYTEDEKERLNTLLETMG